MAAFGSVFGKLSSLFTAGAVGGAAADSVAPVLRLVEQHANAQRAVRVLDPETAAIAEAQQFNNPTALTTTPVDLGDDAKRGGIGVNRYKLLTQLARTVPGTAETLELWRRKRITKDEARHALQRAGIEERYWGPILELKGERLDPADVANAVQQDFLANDNLLPGTPSTTYGINDPTVKHSIPFETVPLKDADGNPVTTLDEFAAAGIDPDRAKVLAELVGLPPGVIELLQMWNRHIIDEPSVESGIREGHTKTKWIAALKELRRMILTPHDYVQGHLRGWRTQQEMWDGAALSGLSREDTNLLYSIERRPLTPHAITTGLARGGTFNPQQGELTDPYDAAVHQENLGPEWYDLAKANKYSYPSGFQIRSEAQKGDLTAAQTEKILLELGWKPEWATFFSQRWTAGATAATDPHVSKAQTQLWGTTHRSYVAEEIDNPTATTAIEAAGVPAATAPAVLALWGHERALVRKQLSPAQIKKAVHEAVTNPATGQPWTQADALAALMARGYDQADATTLLEL